ncbi:winged helix-turn-helix transcriptional regulator [Ktedonobacter racemifer]|uniref:Transcriptional regulator, HxlR family n=1 Tax=Ktedonobacter racemifer DSM 44963 TaxID=485913 RepID=D6U857_KTERA|nr:helix-turn-helix domain-containing protein [Ktedonobacter racemifer]EFH80068.1 transcriptional regulator, HxlR family [Ktedonobacter racemifer DSM 44963]
MRRQRFASMACPIARSLDIIGEWWTLLIVRDLARGINRFDTLQEDLGIARNMLTVRLQTLLDHGVIERHCYQQRPERFEYHLTEKGAELTAVLRALKQWGERWTEAPSSSPVISLADGQKDEDAVFEMHAQE